MNNEPIPTVAPSNITRIIEGIVIAIEIGSWAGFHSGRITIESENEDRSEFRYGRDSDGSIPKIGDFVSVEYTGESIHEISTIRIIEHNRESSYQKRSRQSSTLSLIWGRPKGAVAIVITMVLVGIYIIWAGLSLGNTRPAAPIIYGSVGFAQFIFAWLIWEYTK